MLTTCFGIFLEGATRDEGGSMTSGEGLVVGRAIWVGETKHWEMTLSGLPIGVSSDVIHSFVIVGHHESLRPSAQECIDHWKLSTQT